MLKRLLQGVAGARSQQLLALLSHLPSREGTERVTLPSATIPLEDKGRGPAGLKEPQLGGGQQPRTRLGEKLTLISRRGGWEIPKKSVSQVAVRQGKAGWPWAVEFGEKSILTVLVDP